MKDRAFRENVLMGLLVLFGLASLVGYSIAGSPKLGKSTVDTIFHIDLTNSRVGINDTTPSVALDVTGALNVTGNSTLGDAAADTLDLNVTTVTVNTNVAGLHISTNTTAGATPIISVDGSNRRVGIGKASPGTLLDVNGATTLGGQTSQYSNIVRVSTAASSSVASDYLCLVGAVAALPTTGYSRGCLAFLLSDLKLYVSTETIAGVQSWISVGSQ